MAHLVGEPTVERLGDVTETGSASWGGAQITFRVMPAPGEEWRLDLIAACLLDGRAVPIPEAVAQSREWDANPESSFSCYAPEGNLRDGTRVTLLVRPRAKETALTGGPLWRGEFRAHFEDGQYSLEEIVSLSDATSDQLQTLPGIGPKIAQVIIAYRQAHGPFTSVGQLEEVPMIGANKVQRLEGLVRE